jgi:dTDP-glucose 4,6-dehydratase
MGILPNAEAEAAADDARSREEEFRRWVKYTHDRPFNDHRYAVDAGKLKGLGWVQKTGFEEGLRVTVEWYRRFGERWWGDIGKVLSPFPVVTEGMVVGDGEEHVSDYPLTGGGEGEVDGKGKENEKGMRRVTGQTNEEVNGQTNGEGNGVVNGNGC